MNHQLESRMREIRLSGSEGGGTLVLPTPISAWQSHNVSGIRVSRWVKGSLVAEIVNP